MKKLLLGLAAAFLVTAAVMLAQVRINPTDPQPTCNMCPGTYIPLSELDAYTKKAMTENLVDQQVRDVDIGKANIGIGMVYRGKLDAPAADSVAEHDQVSEVYHIISGTATLMLGPDITNRQRRPATQRTVVEFNGPGNNGSDIRERRGVPVEGGRCRRYSRRHGPLVHEDRRSHQLPDDSYRSGQGRPRSRAKRNRRITCRSPRPDKAVRELKKGETDGECDASMEAGPVRSSGSARDARRERDSRARRPAEWRRTGGDAGNIRYSPLDQINATNVKNLKIAWIWRGDNFGSQPEYKNETTPSDGRWRSVLHRW